jgi:hypothetical protein
MGYKLMVPGGAVMFMARLTGRGRRIVRTLRTKFATRVNNLALIETIAIDVNTTSVISAGKSSYPTKTNARA